MDTQRKPNESYAAFYRRTGKEALKAPEPTIFDEPVQNERKTANKSRQTGRKTAVKSRRTMNRMKSNRRTRRTRQN